MALMTLSQVIEALPKLDQKELETVKAAIEQLLNGLCVTDIDKDLYAAAIEALGVKDIGVSKFIKTKAAKTWIENQGCVNSLIDRIIGDLPKRKVKTVHLKRFLISLLVADLKIRTNTEIIMPVLAARLADVDRVWEQAFPGYLQAGLTHLVLKGLGA